MRAGCREHQAREELARHLTVDGDRAAREAVGLDDDRKVPSGAFLDDPHAELPQRVDARAEGAAAQLRVAVEAEPPVPEREHRKQEPCGRSGLSGVELSLAHRDLAIGAVDDDDLAVTVDVELHAEALQRREHRLGVVGEQHTAQRAHAIGQGGSHERAVREALRPGHSDVDVGRRRRAAGS